VQPANLHDRTERLQPHTRDGRGSSRYKGVHWHREHRKWEAQITYRGRLIHIGYYDYETDAAIAYDDMAVELFGEFACLNCNYHPEIRQWLGRTYFFEPTKNDLNAEVCSRVSHNG
jgi:hypothetical protein